VDWAADQRLGAFQDGGRCESLTITDGFGRFLLQLSTGQSARQAEAWPAKPGVLKARREPLKALSRLHTLQWDSPSTKPVDIYEPANSIGRHLTLRVDRYHLTASKPGNEGA
jgi:hypothetical protein